LTDHISWNNIVITMKAMHVSIRQIGNSQGVVIPKPVLAQLGLSGEAGAEMTIEGGALVLRRPASPVRTGWAEAARKIAEAGDDTLVMGEFGNAADTELVPASGARSVRRDRALWCPPPKCTITCVP
jgi:antitoxin MazE